MKYFVVGNSLVVMPDGGGDLKNMAKIAAVFAGDGCSVLQGKSREVLLMIFDAGGLEAMLGHARRWGWVKLPDSEWKGIYQLIDGA